jgi:hypothetical protein
MIDDLLSELKPKIDNDTKLKSLFENYRNAYSGLEWMAGNRFGRLPEISELARRIFEIEAWLQGMLHTTQKRDRVQLIRHTNLVQTDRAMASVNNEDRYELERIILFVSKELDLRLFQVNCLKSAKNSTLRRDIPGAIWRQLIEDATREYNGVFGFYSRSENELTDYCCMDYPARWLREHGIDVKLPSSNMSGNVPECERKFDCREDRVIMFRE